MPRDEKSQQLTKIKFDFKGAPRSRSPHYEMYYANFCEVAMSGLDVHLKFVTTMLDHPPTSFRVEEQACVFMSLPQAKRLCRALYTNIRNYEKDHGKIQIPDEKDEAPPFE
jgi:hypothetical protein